MYLRQLLKTYNSVDGSIVRPFIILLYVLSKVEYLSLDEFTYLLPLCTSAEYTEQIIGGIQACRNHTVSFDDIIINRLLEMDNYQAALDKLLENTVTESLICEIGLNRKAETTIRHIFAFMMSCILFSSITITLEFRLFSLQLRI